MRFAALELYAHCLDCCWLSNRMRISILLIRVSSSDPITTLMLRKQLKVLSVKNVKMDVNLGVVCSVEWIIEAWEQSHRW